MKNYLIILFIFWVSLSYGQEKSKANETFDAVILEKLTQGLVGRIGVAAQEIGSGVNVTINGVDPSVLDPFVGVFKGTFQDLEITTNGGRYQFVQNSKLTKPGANPAPANLANTTEGWFIITEGPNKGELGELLEDLSGERNYLRFSHRIFIRFTEENDEQRGESLRCATPFLPGNSTCFY